MIYNNAFAIDDVLYKDRKNDNSNVSSPYILKNFDYYFPNLIEDFYLKYFIREALFELHVSELNAFLQYHYDYCESPDEYFSTLENEVLIKISEIIENANFSLEFHTYHNEVKLEDGFVETEGTIKNSYYEYESMYHITALKNLQFSLERKAVIIENFIKAYRDRSEIAPLRWIAGPSKLSFIISELIDKGYMTADKKRGEINYSKLSRDITKAFSIQGGDSVKSLEIYLSPVNKKHIKTKEVFIKRGFNLPKSDHT